jgi:hypothetical protein
VIVGTRTRPVLAPQRLEPGDARLAQALGVGHDVRLRHRHEIGGAEELAHLDLVLERALRRRAVLARQHRSFEIVQLHGTASMEVVIGTLPRMRRANS